MEIQQICHSESSDAKDRLVSFARKCSWQGTGSFFAELLEENAFEITEKVVAAYDGGRIVGFAALVNESCVDDICLSPWLDFLFVDEQYRNKGIAKAMVDVLMRVALTEGIETVYLCTVTHKQMYESLGFSTLYKTKINGADECFVMKKHISVSEYCK